MGVFVPDFFVTTSASAIRFGNHTFRSHVVRYGVPENVGECWGIWDPRVRDGGDNDVNMAT